MCTLESEDTVAVWCDAFCIYLRFSHIALQWECARNRYSFIYTEIPFVYSTRTIHIYILAIYIIFRILLAVNEKTKKLEFRAGVFCFAQRELNAWRFRQMKVYFNWIFFCCTWQNQMYTFCSWNALTTFKCCECVRMEFPLYFVFQLTLLLFRRCVCGVSEFTLCIQLPQVYIFDYILCVVQTICSSIAHFFCVVFCAELLQNNAHILHFSLQHKFIHSMFILYRISYLFFLPVSWICYPFRLFLLSLSLFPLLDKNTRNETQYYHDGNLWFCSLLIVYFRIFCYYWLHPVDIISSHICIFICGPLEYFNFCFVVEQKYLYEWKSKIVLRASCRHTLLLISSVIRYVSLHFVYPRLFRLERKQQTLEKN